MYSRGKLRTVAHSDYEQVAVAPQAQGTHVILCTVAGEDVDQTAVIATLDPQTRPQQRLKLVYSEPTMFTLVQGEGPVYLSGTEVLTNAYDEVGFLRMN